MVSAGVKQRRPACTRARCDVFLSFKNLDKKGRPTRDSELAREIHDYLTTRKLRVFLSTVSLERMGVDAYKRAIDEALDAASVVIAVGTSRENLDSKWVNYEWDGFLSDILSGKKPNGRVFAYVEGIAPGDVPRGLRRTQVFVHGPDAMEQLYQFLVPAGAQRSRKTGAVSALVDASPYVASSTQGTSGPPTVRETGRASAAAVDVFYQSREGQTVLMVQTFARDPKWAEVYHISQPGGERRALLRCLKVFGNRTSPVDEATKEKCIMNTIENILDLKPDVVGLGGMGSTARRIRAALAESGFKGKIEHWGGDVGMDAAEFLRRHGVEPPY